MPSKGKEKKEGKKKKKKKKKKRRDQTELLPRHYSLVYLRGRPSLPSSALVSSVRSRLNRDFHITTVATSQTSGSRTANKKEGKSKVQKSSDQERNRSVSKRKRKDRE
jgi:hypothetical protein